MPSRRLPEFKASITKAKAGDSESMALVRVEMIHAMAACPDKLLLMLAQMLAEFHADEWHQYHEQN